MEFPILNMNSIIIIDQKFGKSLIFLSSFIQNTYEKFVCTIDTYTYHV